MGGLTGEERVVVLLLLGLALAAGTLLWWQGHSERLGLAWGGTAQGIAVSEQPAAAGQETKAGVSTDDGPDGETNEQPGAEIIVHVAGAVVRPGVYALPEGSRFVDAVQAAGGPAGGADANAVNLARRVSDGERLYVPTREETRRGDWTPGEFAGGGGSGGAAPVGRKVNVNTATQAELESLPGIGPSLASRIIDYRTRHGPFKALEELLNVSGIGEKRLADLEGLVTTD